MRNIYLKGFISIICIFSLNFLINKAVPAKIDFSKYQFTLKATQLDMRKGAVYTIATEGKDVSKIHWLSSDPKIVTVNKNGQLISKKVGQSIITAKISNDSKDIIVNVLSSAKADILVYNDSQTIAVTNEKIDKISIANFHLSLSKNKYTYNGKAKKPKVEVKSTDNVVLHLGKDYVVKYSKNKKPGKAKVIVTGINKYTGTLVGTFKITKSIDKDNNDSNIDSDSDTNIVDDSNDRNSDTSNVASTVTSLERSENDSLTPTTSTKNNSSSTISRSTQSSTVKKKSNSSTKKSTTTNSTTNSTSKSKKSSSSKSTTSNSKKTTSKNTHSDEYSNSSNSSSNDSSSTNSSTNSSGSSNNSNSNSNSNSSVDGETNTNSSSDTESTDNTNSTNTTSNTSNGSSNSVSN